MPKNPFDIRIKTVGGSDIGYMMWRNQNGQRSYTVEDTQTIAPRLLTQEQLSQSQLPPDIALTFPQTNWRRGIGGIRFQAQDLDVLADATRMDVSSQGKIKLARQTLATTVDSTPNTYDASGFTVSGDDVWSFIGQDVYKWDFSNKQWDIQTEPIAAARIYRNAVNFEGTLYAPAWADDAGSGGSYTADDEPCNYIYKTAAATTFAAVTNAAQTLDGCKYMAVADQKLWGGYWTDAADSTINIDGPNFDAASSSSTDDVSSVTLAHTCATNGNRLLVVGVGSHRSAGAAYPTGVTYAGVALTALTSSRTTSGTRSVSMWYLVAPATGTNNIVVTFAASHTEVIVGGTSFIGVAQTSTISDQAAATGTSTSPAVSLGATAADELCISIEIDATGSGDPTIGGSQTQRWNQTNSNIDGAGGTREATSTSTTLNWTLGSSVLWLIAAVAVVPVACSSSLTTIPVSGTPSSKFVAGDVIRVDSELMLVTAVDDTPGEITVVRGYRGSVAAAHDNDANIFEVTENPHQVRSATDGTALGNWSTATSVGDSSAAITALVGVGSNLIVIKTDGIYRLEADGTVTNLRPELSALAHKDFGKGAWAWNDLIFIPLHGGGLWELETATWTVRDVSFSISMPEETQYHGRVVAGHGEPNKLYVLVHEAGNTQYHVMMTENPSSAGIDDYNWTVASIISYDTTTDTNHAALLLEAVTNGSNEHHRLLIGVMSTITDGSEGSNLLPYFMPHDSHDLAAEFATTAGVADTVDFDGGFPNVSKRAQDITINATDLENQVDTGIDTNEALDTSETVIDLDADPTNKIGVGDIITIDSEKMLVTAIDDSPTNITVTRGYAGTTAATHNTNANVFFTHYIYVQYQIDGGALTYVTGSQSTSTLTSNNQTLAFAQGITFKRISFRFTMQRLGVTITTSIASPELHDFTFTCQLRPTAVKQLPLALYIANGIKLNNGIIENKGKTKRDQLRTWNTQAAEVVVTDIENGTRNCVFLPGQMRETEMFESYHGFPQYRVDVVLAEVG